MQNNEQHLAARSIIMASLTTETYNRIKNHIPEDIFRPALKSVFRVVTEAQEKFGRDLSLEEVKALHEAKNPAMSKDQKSNLDKLYDALDDTDVYGPDVAEELLRIAYSDVIADKLADVAVKLQSDPGDNENTVEELRLVFEEACNILVKDADKGDLSVKTSMKELIEADDPGQVKMINIPKFKDVAPYIPDGMFVVLGARPNSGKTSFLATITSGPNGFLDQGYKTLFCLNEESVPRVIRRHLTIRANTPWDIIKVTHDKEHDDIMDELLERNVYTDISAGCTLMDVERQIELHEPDVLITDILDKVHQPGIFQREDLKLERIYRSYRDIGKKYNIPVIGCSQVSDEGTGRFVLTADMLKDSRTGKYAEADAIWMIGRGPSDPNKADADDPRRCINVAKDKLHAKDGYHRYVQLVDANIGLFTG